MCSAEIGVLKSSTNFIGKRLCWRLSLIKFKRQACYFIKKNLQHWCFSVKSSKFLGAPILKSICEQLLLWKLPCWRWLKFGIGLLSEVVKSSTTATSFKNNNNNFLWRFSDRRHGYAALRKEKELLLAPFVECLGKPYW